MVDFVPIKRTKTKKAKIMLYLDEYDKERMDDLPPYDVTTQEKIRQLIKAFLDRGELGIGDDLEGL